MIEHLNGNTFYGYVRMVAEATPGLFVVVEGPYDKFALEKHAIEGLAVLSGSGGREHILRAAGLAHVTGLRKVRFLVDRDYDLPGDDDSIRKPNVLSSSSHDLFTDLLQGDPEMLKRLVASFLLGRDGGADGSASTVAAEAIAERAIVHAGKLSAIRIADRRGGLGLSFEAAKLSGNLRSVHSISEMAAFVVRVNQRDDLDVHELSSTAEQAFQEWEDHLLQVVGDHDLLDAVSHGIRSEGAKIGKQELQRALAFGATCRSIASNAWFKDIQDWCSSGGFPGFECKVESAVAA